VNPQVDEILGEGVVATVGVMEGTTVSRDEDMHPAISKARIHRHIPMMGMEGFIRISPATDYLDNIYAFFERCGSP
jgi:hypothetical protein